MDGWIFGSGNRMGWDGERGLVFCEFEMGM